MARIHLFLAILLASATAHVAYAAVIDICSDDEPPADLPGEVVSPKYPAPYDNQLDCGLIVEAPTDGLLRLEIAALDLRDGDDVLMIKCDGVETEVRGSTPPKGFIGATFEIVFTSDDAANNGTGFSIIYDEYMKDAVSTKVFTDEIDLKPGKALHLYSNDYPMTYDDNTYYSWNITSSSTNELVLTIVDLDTEAQRDWLEVTSHSESTGSTQLLRVSGTPMDEIAQITVQDADYVTVEFMSDYSRSGHGFHIIVEPEIAVSSQGAAVNCGGEFTLGAQELEITLPEPSSDRHCVWTIRSNGTDSRLRVMVDELVLEQGTEYLQISVGDSSSESNWKGYRRRLTGSVTDEVVFVEDGSVVSMVLHTGSSSINRALHVHVGRMPDYGCGGTLDLTRNGRGTLSIGNLPTDMTSFSCLWLIKTAYQTNINFDFSEVRLESHYDFLEIGTGQNPTDIASRQKLITDDVTDQTFATYSGDMWLLLSAEDHAPGDDVTVTAALEDNACRIKTILDLSGEIDSPVLDGVYPDDADCQWILQVRGGFQVRLHFTEFDLEYGHDQLLIGGTVPDVDDVDSSYLVLTGSELPEDVVSRYNGLNLRFKTDSSVTRSGFKLTFEEFFDCPDGYQYNPTNETCYKFVATPANWLDARYDCNGVADGDLVVISDETENEYVLEMIRSMQASNETDTTENWWIGFYDAAINGSWSWVDCEESSLFGSFNWQPGAPDNTDDRHFAYISSEDGLYNEDFQTTPRSYVCEITRKNYVDSDSYPSNFRAISETYSSVVLAFDASEYLCDVWGYRMRYNTSTGVYGEVYLEGATNTVTTVQGLMQGTTYHFELDTCTISYGCFGYSTSLSVLATTAVCPANFPYGYGTSCYAVVAGNANWTEARRGCLATGVENAAMVNIETSGENEYLESIISSGSYWIGLYDVVEEGEFYWSYDCSIPDDYDYSNWDGINHPKNDMEDCAYMSSNGLWGDSRCDTTSLNGYICEMTDRPFGSDPSDIEPSRFNGSAVDFTTVRLVWRPANLLCDVRGYIINVYKMNGGDLVLQQYVTGGESFTTVITGLQKSTMYTFVLETDSFSFKEFMLPQTITVGTLGLPVVLECSATTMSVSVPLELLSVGVTGPDLQLLNDASCEGVLSENGEAIVVTTDLAACNNDREENDITEFYSNTVVERANEVVSRVSDVYIPFTCAYNRTGHVGLRSYELQNYRLNVTQESTGQYEFALDIYRDGSFDEKYTEDDYPIEVELNQDLFFGAFIASNDDKLNLAITRCVTTPYGTYNDDPYVLIDEGCEVDESTTIGPDGLDFVGVTTKAFRFVGQGNRVYIHCDLLVCDATLNNRTECDVTCSDLRNARNRRDVTAVGGLAHKRISRGPIRFRRTSDDIDSLSQYDDKAYPATGFNLWMLTIVAMAAIFLTLIIVIVIVTKRLRSTITAQRRMTDDEAAAPLISE